MWWVYERRNQYDQFSRLKSGINNHLTFWGIKELGKKKFSMMMEIKSLVLSALHLRWRWYMQWVYQMGFQEEVWGGHVQSAVVSPDMTVKATRLDELIQRGWAERKHGQVLWPEAYIEISNGNEREWEELRSERRWKLGKTSRQESISRKMEHWTFEYIWKIKEEQNRKISNGFGVREMLATFKKAISVNG